MRAGLLRKRLQLWQRQLVSDAQGEQIPQWSLQATVWGALVPVAAQERDMADREFGQVTHEITVRFGAIDPKPHQQIRFQGRSFDLGPVRNIDERNRTLALAATEIVAEA